MRRAIGALLQGTISFAFVGCRILDLNVSYGGLVTDAPPYTLQTGWSSAQTLTWQGTLRQPMFSMPGAEYCYLNANFHLAGYVVEKACAYLVLPHAVKCSSLTALLSGFIRGAHTVVFCVQLTNMSLAAYFDKYILQPAGLNSTYYWLSGQGLEPAGIRKNVVSLPSYIATFQTAPGEGTS